MVKLYLACLLSVSGERRRVLLNSRRRPFERPVAIFRAKRTKNLNSSARFSANTATTMVMVAALRPLSIRCRRRSLCLVVSCRYLASSASALNVAVLTGTTRQSGPPRPVLGPRAKDFIVDGLERRGHTVTVFDPRELDLPLLDKPEFAYSRTQVPAQLKEMQEALAAAHAYVAITPEYNHAPSPALVNMINHFGSSTFSFKPSAIVSYSAGQWGGTRAAIALRPILSELG